MKKDTLTLDTIHVKNFRAFADCTLKLDLQLTVLVAENGQGKTALLDAIGKALGPVVEVLSQEKQNTTLHHDDVRLFVHQKEHQHALPVLIEAQGTLDGKKMNWGVTRKSIRPRSRTSTTRLKPLKDHANKLRQRLEDYAQNKRDIAPPLPLIAHYGTGRLWTEERVTQRRRRRETSEMRRLKGYQDCLTPSSSFKMFSAWYGHQFNLLTQGSTAARTLPKDQRPEQLLAAVNQATSIVLEPTGWHTLDWQREDTHEGHLVVEHKDQSRLPLSLLSDGVRNMIALVGDIAHRCVRLNPQFGQSAAENTPGVVLVDEVDMHLHPGWQQKVMGLLCKAFPRLQWVVTTHSPQVLSSVHMQCVRVIRMGEGQVIIDTPTLQTRGVTSSDILARVMGIHPVPPTLEAEQLKEYRGLIEDGLAHETRAKALREILLDHFGEQHPIITQCDQLIRFQDFRLRRQRKPS